MTCVLSGRVLPPDTLVRTQKRFGRTERQDER